MLESNLHGDNAFVTLTYNDENIPRTKDDLPTLLPKDTQDWLKRLRFLVKPLKLRYYLVGEYGDQTQRPHYHVALFGYPSCRYGRSRYTLTKVSCCSNCDLIQSSWGLGKVLLGSLETESAQYICGYVTKKMTSSRDERLDGRHPEFSRMSLKPGIGADFMHEVASTMLTLNLDTMSADVPSALSHGKRTLPLGRYLRRKLRKAIGKDENAPLESRLEHAEKMRPLLIASKTDKENPSLKSQILKNNQQAVLNQATRNKIYKGKKTL